LQEKKILDDVVRRIHDEDQRYILWSQLRSLFWWIENSSAKRPTR
jgi:hypothetical protein